MARKNSNPDRSLKTAQRTEEANAGWIRHCIFFHGVRRPAEMGAAQINQFLADHPVNGHASASTQNQAQSALLFLYDKVLGVPFEQLQGVIRAEHRRRLLVVLTRPEVQAVFAHLAGVPWLVSSLLYGGGLAVPEGRQVRVKYFDFSRGEVVVRDGKGQKDRVTVLPAAR